MIYQQLHGVSHVVTKERGAGEAAAAAARRIAGSSSRRALTRKLARPRATNVLRMRYATATIHFYLPYSLIICIHSYIFKAQSKTFTLKHKLGFRLICAYIIILLSKILTRHFSSMVANSNIKILK